jgi:type III restriction enzyme
MAHLFQLFSDQVNEWRANGYQSEYSAISEILEYARHQETNQLRFLRAAQLKALEIYWYLRLVEKTPHTFELYKKYYSDPIELLAVLGIDYKQDEVARLVFGGIDNLFEKIKTDDDFAARMKFEALRETITLDYPSYILALAMGAGKTILIGSIIAIEFAMAMEYPQPEDGQKFVKNALVFAPGKTILGALKEIADIPFEKILPPRFIKSFNANLKLTFTQDGEKDLPIIRGSVYNLIVTNTEKIRIQKSTGKRRGNANQINFGFDEREAEETEIANLRLQALASLPNLGIFSDEAHHTYGQNLEDELKKVRKTVDYLHQNTNVVCVVNTTGTPYYQKQPLKDVVTWYGLSQGIEDNVLKEIGDNVNTFSSDKDETQASLTNALRDFFGKYRDVALPNGAKAKIAIYFPQEDDLTEYRPVIEKTLAELGIPITAILKNTSKSSVQEIADFDALNDPATSYRVILLVNKGTEGWNCPSLFATVLARKLKTSNNFVLQAGTRCLRQVLGNTHPASIYLSHDNRKILDEQLQETFGESLKNLEAAKQNSVKETITLRKLNLPKLQVKKFVRSIVEKADAARVKAELSFTMPEAVEAATITRRVYRMEKSDMTKSVLQQESEEEIAIEDDTVDLRTIATELAANYRLDNATIYGKLKELYAPEIEAPRLHLVALSEQITEQSKLYEEREIEVIEALALVKLEGFDKAGEGDAAVYTAEISYQKNKAHLILSEEQTRAENPREFGFHYSPYNFDSSPEHDFFTKMLKRLNTKPEEVEDMIFLGGLTSTNKTDVYIEYMGEDGKWHHYFPDFIIRRKDGKCLIVEIKAMNKKTDATDGENGRKAMALKRWENLNPDTLKYQMIFADDSVSFSDLDTAQKTVNDF